MATAEGSIHLPATDKPPRSRRWIPLSLKMVAAILVVLGIAGAWRCVRGYQQLLVIREIERLGGSAELESQWPDWLYEQVGFENMRMFDEVKAVVLKSDVSEVTLSRIAGLPHLKSLWLRDSQVTDAGLARLGGMTSLEQLNLAKTKVTDAGLVNLRGLTNVKRHILDDKQATDAGRAHLKHLTSLEWLVLDMTRVPDTKLGAFDSATLTLLETHWLFDANDFDSLFADSGGWLIEGFRFSRWRQGN